MTTTATPKGTLTLSNLSPNLGAIAKKPTGLLTLKHVKGDVTTSLTFSDQTARDVKSLKDTVLTCDYKYNRQLKLTGAFDFSNKTHKAIFDWNGSVFKRATGVKSTWVEHGNKTTTELSTSINLTNKATLTLNKFSLASAKLSHTRGKWLIEPMFNAVSKSPSLAVTKRAGLSAYKVSYDLKSEAAALEWNRKPYKLTLSTKAGKSGIAKPTLACIFEKDYVF